jgi:hypothetical protein
LVVRQRQVPIGIRPTKRHLLVAVESAPGWAARVAGTRQAARDRDANKNKQHEPSAESRFWQVSTKGRRRHARSVVMAGTFTSLERVTLGTVRARATAACLAERGRCAGGPANRGAVDVIVRTRARRVGLSPTDGGANS